MNSRIARSLTLCLCSCLLILLGANSLLAQGNKNSKHGNNETESIKALLQTQVDCWNRRDLKGFMQTYWNSEQLTFSSGGETTNGWQDTFERYQNRYQSEGAEMGTLAFDELKVGLLSDQVALVLGNWKLKMKKSNPQGNFSLVMRKMKDGWKIIHDHSSSLDKK